MIQPFWILNSYPNFTIGSVILKTAVLEPERFQLKRELNVYREPPIATCPYIRKLLDVAEPDNTSSTPNQSCAVLEWMDHDLRSVPSEPFRASSDLPKMIAKSILSVLAILDENDGIHSGMFATFQPVLLLGEAKLSDINPNNVFLSDISGVSPVVKVGDLGNGMFVIVAHWPRKAHSWNTVMREGFDTYRGQSLPTRAPEVWRGLGCWPSSDVWSAGVTVSENILLRRLCC